VQLTEQSRDIIYEILNLDPHKRPNIDELISNIFLTKNQIPKMLPTSTLACPPS